MHFPPLIFFILWPCKVVIRSFPIICIPVIKKERNLAEKETFKSLFLCLLSFEIFIWKLLMFALESFSIGSSSQQISSKALSKVCFFSNTYIWRWWVPWCSFWPRKEFRFLTVSAIGARVEWLPEVPAKKTIIDENGCRILLNQHHISVITTQSFFRCIFSPMWH